MERQGRLFLIQIPSMYKVAVLGASVMTAIRATSPQQQSLEVVEWRASAAESLARYWRPRGCRMVVQRTLDCQ